MSDSEEELGPLPAGRHGFTSEQVAHNQRERILAAVAEVVADRGYPAITVADITEVAHVSRRTFYEQFDGKEDCFLAAFDVVVEHLRRLIESAVEPSDDWPHQVAVGIRATLEFFVEEPKLAKLCMVDAVTAGPKVSERYQEAVAGFASLLRPGRKLHEAATELPDSTEGTILGSIASVITREVLAGRTAELGELHADFVAFTLTPYIGANEARKLAAA